jgi:hypothetical protein
VNCTYSQELFFHCRNCLAFKTDNYTFQEYEGMHFILSEARGNSAAAVRRYAERFPHRRHPNQLTFHAINVHEDDTKARKIEAVYKLWRVFSITVPMPFAKSASSVDIRPRQELFPVVPLTTW